jgi:hypothetical protein
MGAVTGGVTGMTENQGPRAATLKLGDRVKIKDFDGTIGRIAELRGPLGPNGAPVYRVLVQRKPSASYIELLGDQLEIAPTAGRMSRVKRPKGVPRKQNDS